MQKQSHSFKHYLLKLADDSLPEEEKKKRKKKRKAETEEQDIKSGLLKYIQISNAGDA